MARWRIRNSPGPGFLGNAAGRSLPSAAQAQPQLVAIERVNTLDDADGRPVHFRDSDVDLLGVLAGVEAVEVQIGVETPVHRVHENAVFVDDPRFSLALAIVVHDEPVSDDALLVGLVGLLPLCLRLPLCACGCSAACVWQICPAAPARATTTSTTASTFLILVTNMAFTTPSVRAPCTNCFKTGGWAPRLIGSAGTA